MCRSGSLGKRIFQFLFASLLITSSYVFAAATDSPVGTWRTIDDQTGQPRSIIQITQSGGGLQGRIVKVFYRSGEGPKDLCVKCSGSFHNKLILGMTNMWGLQSEGDNKWSGGQILDPSNGKIYKAMLTLNPDGRTLQMRGYIGIPLLGRTQTWTRVK